MASPRKTNVVPSTREFVLPENLVGIDPNVNMLMEGNCYSFKNLIVKEFKYSKYLSMSAVTELEEVKDIHKKELYCSVFTTNELHYVHKARFKCVGSEVFCKLGLQY